MARQMGLSKIVMLFHSAALHQRRMRRQTMLRNRLNRGWLLQEWIWIVLRQSIMLKQVLILGCGSIQARLLFFGRMCIVYAIVEKGVSKWPRQRCYYAWRPPELRWLRQAAFRKAV